MGGGSRQDPPDSTAHRHAPSSVIGVYRRLTRDPTLALALSPASPLRTVSLLRVPLSIVGRSRLSHSTGDGTDIERGREHMTGRFLEKQHRITKIFIYSSQSLMKSPSALAPPCEGINRSPFLKVWINCDCVN